MMIILQKKMLLQLAADSTAADGSDFTAVLIAAD